MQLQMHVVFHVCPMHILPLASFLCCWNRTVTADSCPSAPLPFHAPPLPHCAHVPPGFSSCIIALPKVHPTAALAAIWPLLAPSASFVVFSPWAQPLAEAHTHLQASKQCLMLQLQESWLRPYQVGGPTHTHTPD